MPERGLLAEFVSDLGHATTLDDSLTRYAGHRWDEVVAAIESAVGLCAASHIRQGHHLRLREAGAVHLANSWDEVETIAARFLA